MSVSVLLITHNDIGEQMLQTACVTFGVCPLHIRSMAVSGDSGPERILAESRQLLRELDQGDGVLVLTDAYGSTPCNIATRLAGMANVAVVSGLNLPMLLKVMNYPQLSLEELQLKAVSGGKEGVVLIKNNGAA